jgi:hypothetical protein
VTSEESKDRLYQSEMPEVKFWAIYFELLLIGLMGIIDADSSREAADASGGCAKHILREV